MLTEVRTLLGEDRHLTLFEKFWVVVTSRIRTHLTTALGPSSFRKVAGYADLGRVVRCVISRVQVIEVMVDRWEGGRKASAHT